MIKRPWVLVATVFLFVLNEPTMAQTGPPDAAKGRELAERLCSNCHAVAPDAMSAQPSVPGFVAIARMPNMTPERLAGAIILPHPAMPGVALTRAELRDIIAYITSLKP